MQSQQQRTCRPDPCMVDPRSNRRAAKQQADAPFGRCRRVSHPLETCHIFQLRSSEQDTRMGLVGWIARLLMGML